MRVMIPASGGLDSSLLLYEALTQTDHEIIALHHDETAYMPRSHWPADFGVRSAAAFDNVAAWLRLEARDFETVVHPEVTGTDAAGDAFPIQRVPSRPGFLRHHDIRGLRIRAATNGTWAKRFGVAEVWIAHTTWDHIFFHDPHPAVTAAFAEAAGPGITLRTPWTNKSGEAWTGRSRLDSLRRIPPELHALTLQCYTGRTPCRGFRPLGADRLDAACKVCEPRHFYEEHCRTLADNDLQIVAERIEYFAGFGRHHERANPETHNFRMSEEVICRYGGRLCEEPEIGVPGSLAAS